MCLQAMPWPKLTFKMKPGVSMMVRFGQKAYLQQHTCLLFHLWARGRLASAFRATPAIGKYRLCQAKPLFKAVKGNAHSARITMGLEETVVPSALRCFSVRSLMRSATALSGMMGGPYSSDSSSWIRHLGSRAAMHKEADLMMP